MPGFSYTAPQFTKEDNEREIADLTTEEKGDILDDMYGRNSNDLIIDGEVLEITEKQLDAINNAMDRIPIEDRSGYIKASVRCPELLETESNPAVFLRHQNYNSELAAKRITKYWNIREEVFGEQRAFLPMTQSGAMGDEETMHALIRCPHFRDFLPNDVHGRTVLGSECSSYHLRQCTRYSLVRLLWYKLHLALKRRSTIEKGLVFVQISSSMTLNDFDRIGVKMLLKVSQECFPIDFRAVHMLSSSRSVQDLVLPAFCKMLSWKLRRRMYIHRQSGQRLLKELCEFGLEREGLPTSICGTFQWNPSWVDEQGDREEDA